MSNTKLRRRALLGGGPDVVDFGLSVKWLKCNLAGDKLTNNESDYGYYYQWASTTGYPDASTHVFSSSWTDTPYCIVAAYVSFSKYGTKDKKYTLEPMDDAVTVLLGSEYRMPTIDEFNELFNHCGLTLSGSFLSGSLSGTTSVSSTGRYWVAAGTTVDGIKYKNPGCLCVGQDITKRVFFPASGRCINSSVSNVGYQGGYWSSSLDSSNSKDPYNLCFTSSNYNSDIRPANHGYYRYSGFSVRGVKIA